MIMRKISFLLALVFAMHCGIKAQNQSGVIQVGPKRTISKATLQQASPAKEREVIIHYDGDNHLAIQAGGSPYIGAIRLTSDELSSYYGNSSIVKARCYIYDASTLTNIRMLIYGNGTATEPGALLVDETLATDQVVTGWNEFTLPTPLALTSGDYWVGFDVTAPAQALGVDAGPMIPGKGGWIYSEGITSGWDGLTEYSLDYNWNIRAVLSPNGGGTYPPATNVQATANGSDVTVTWNAPAKGRAVLLSEEFDSGIPADWTQIDANEDGNIWNYSSSVGYNAPGSVYSESYTGGADITPDNYLITPLVNGATSINYWVVAHSANYPADNYAVMASSTGTNAEDFTVVFEETLTAKIYRPKERDETPKLGTWYERTVDLPAGTKYVAFRHYNCHGQWAMYIDDVTVYGEASTYSYTVTKNGTEVATGITETNYTDAGVANGTYEYCVKVVYTGGTSVPACAAPVTVNDSEIVIHYDGDNDNELYAGDGDSYIGAIRLTSDELASYYGNSSIEKVRCYIGNASIITNIRMLIYGNGTATEPGELLVDDTLAIDQIVDGWNEFTLPTALPLVSGDYWIGFDLAPNTVTLGVDAGPMVPGKGAWIYGNFTTNWDELTEYSFDCNWNIRAVLAPADEDTYPPATNVQATANGSYVNITWDAPTSGAVILSESFESGSLPSGWTTVDFDGDGINWIIPEGEAHSGTKYVSSKSWEGSALSPDNYLITPLVEGATSVQYWVRSGSNYYTGDKYAVMVSTAGTNLGDFTTVFEETTIAKNANSQSGKSENSPKAPGAWYERNIDLPAGTKYIAFRHYDSYDHWSVDIDDVTVYGGKSSYTYTITRNGAEIVSGITETSYTDTNVANGTHDYCVEVVYAGGTSVPACAAPVTVGTPCNPATNVQATANGSVVNVTWSAPESGGGAFYTYNVIKNNVEIATGIIGTSYTDYGVLDGTHEYCVKVVYADCISPSACASVVGINEDIFSKTFVYPNPATDNLIIDCPENINRVEMFDILGRKVISEDNLSNYTNFNISHLSNGMYFLIIHTANGSGEYRIIKQ
jgi:hypothetical protein